MQKKQVEFSYQIYTGIEELENADATLLLKAREGTVNAYAPYSNFKVSAAAILNNGQIVTGTNQENASYPVAICAERVMLSALSSLYPNEPINTIAISYDSINSNKPISPCGSCRQAISEYENRFSQKIKLIMSGETGEVYVSDSIENLLPLMFSAKYLPKRK